MSCYRMLTEDLIHLKNIYGIAVILPLIFCHHLCRPTDHLLCPRLCELSRLVTAVFSCVLSPMATVNALHLKTRSAQRRVRLWHQLNSSKIEYEPKQSMPNLIVLTHILNWPPRQHPFRAWCWKCTPICYFRLESAKNWPNHRYR